MIAPADQQLLVAVQKYCNSTQHPPPEEADLPEPPDHEKLWRFLHHVSRDSPHEIYPSIFNIIAFYKTVNPEFSEFPPDVIQRDLDRLTDPSRSFEDRAELSKIYIPLLPFLEGTRVLAILNLAIDIADFFLSSKRSMLATFVRVIGDVIVAEFDDGTFRDMVALLKARVQSDKASAAILILSELALEIVRIDDFTGSFLDTVILDALNAEDSDLNLAGCHLLRRYGFHYLSDPPSRPSAETFLRLLQPLMRSTNDSLALIAHKAVRTLVKARVIQSNQDIIALLNGFIESPVNVVYFFRVLHVIVYPVNDQEDETYDPKMDDLVPIRDFAIRVLENPKESPLMKGYCIDLFADLMSIKRSFVSKFNGLAYKCALSILKKKQIVAFPLISSYLVANCQFYPKKRPEIDGFVLTLVETLSKEQCGPLSVRLDLAIDILEMIKINNLQPVPITISAFALPSLSKSETEALRAAAVLLDCVSILIPKQAATAFIRISEHVRATRIVGRVEFFMRVLRKLLKHVAFEHATIHDLAKILCHGALPHFPHRVPPYFSEVPKFLCTYMRKYPGNVPVVLATCERFMEGVSLSNCPRLIALFFTAISLPGLRPEILTRLAKIALWIFKDCPLKHAVEACSPLEFIIEILTHKFDIIPSTELAAAIAHTDVWLSVADLKYQDDPRMQTILEVIPTVAQFVFFVYANTDDIALDKKLVQQILNLMPFPPDAKNQEAVLKNALKVAGKYEKLRTGISLVIVEILVLSEEDRTEFKLSPQLIGTMTFAVREWLKKDPKRKAKVVRRLINAQRDTPAFNRLFE